MHVTLIQQGIEKNTKDGVDGDMMSEVNLMETLVCM